MKEHLVHLGILRNVLDDSNVAGSLLGVVCLCGKCPKCSKSEGDVGSAGKGTLLNVNALDNWRKRKRLGWREFKNELFAKISPPPEGTEAQAKERRTLSSTVDRWRRKFRNKKPVYVNDKYRDALELLGGEVSADWFSEERASLTPIVSDAPTERLLTRESFFAEIFEYNMSKKAYEDDIHESVGLSILGPNLRRIVIHYGRLTHVKKVLDRITANDDLVRDKYCDVRVLMHNPDDEFLCKMALLQDEGRHGNLDAYCNDVRSYLSAFCLLRAKYGNKVKIKYLKYMPAAGYDVFRYPDRNAGVCYVRFYPIPDPREDDKDRPIIRLTQRDAWFDFFSQQFDRHWELASDHLPDEYAWQDTVQTIRDKFSPELNILLDEMLEKSKEQ